ncbi:WD40-repeat-containing domain protein [Daldinia bambusicola]|nr:WD40-repeat-containing domain protein [Daldinia bambusicola]
MSDLCTFLKNKNILSWIEHAASNNNLGDVTRTATNLRAYLGRRMKYLVPMDPSAHLIDCWVTDLIRVTAKFRSQLLACPSSIHYIIPSFCPSESIISRTFANGTRPWAIAVKGTCQTTWGDCLTRVDFDPARVTALNHDSQYFAVGLSTGQISLFDPHSVQCIAKIAHPERVKVLGFSNDGEYLASSGAKTLVVWQLKSRTKRFSYPISRSELIAFAFLADEIPDQPPGRAALFETGETVLLAVGYRNHPIFIWNALELQLLGQCVAGGSNGIDDMTFNPNPEIATLVVSYSDGRLFLFNYVTMMPTLTRPNVYANSIACSPNGHSLVTGSTGGVIEVFEFDQDYAGNIVLVPIYSIQSLEDSIQSIAFSPDALLRKDNELESVSDIVASSPKIIGMSESMAPEITSNLAVSSNGGYIIAGKSNGDVLVFSAVDGKELGVLYRHGRRVSIVNVVLGEANNLFMSTDDSGRLLVAELVECIVVSSVTQQLPSARITMDHRFSASIVSLLVNPTSDRLLISGRNVDELCDLLSGEVLSSISHIDGGVTSRTLSQNVSDVKDGSIAAAAFQHPTNDSWFVLVLASTVRIFCWSNFQELTTLNGIPLQKPPIAAEALLTTQLQSTKTLTTHSSSYYVGQGFVIELLRSSPPRLYVWPVLAFDLETTPLEHPAQLPKELSLSVIDSEILTVLGIVGQSTVVLVDVNLWVYSIELRPKQARPPGRPTFSSANTIVQDYSGSTTHQLLPVFIRRHFFALSEWRTISGELKCAVAQRSGGPEFVFASEGHIIVIQGGLEFSEVTTTGGISGIKASVKRG